MATIRITSDKVMLKVKRISSKKGGRGIITMASMEIINSAEPGFARLSVLKAFVLPLMVSLRSKPGQSTCCPIDNNRENIPFFQEEGLIFSGHDGVSSPHEMRTGPNRCLPRIFYGSGYCAIVIKLTKNNVNLTDKKCLSYIFHGVLFV